MAKPLTNRVLADDVYRRRRTDYLHQVSGKDAEALLASLILRHGKVELDRLTRTCRINGQPIPLTRLEYELLAFLLIHKGEVWNRDELMENVWQRKPSSINLVAVYINSLRRKLGTGMLRTVRGQGYTIDIEKPGRLAVVSRQSPSRTSRKA
jgi:DNA-binding response OmpR family regulator